mgnify:CR=1 FL=1
MGPLGHRLPCIGARIQTLSGYLHAEVLTRGVLDPPGGVLQPGDLVLVGSDVLASAGTSVFEHGLVAGVGDFEAVEFGDLGLDGGVLQ